MSPTPTSFPPRQLLEVRPAREDDRPAISNLIVFGTHVHKHLDWKAPLDWLGCQPFMVLQDGSQLAAALACPPDPDPVAWLRLFAFNSELNGAMAWRMLWPAVVELLAARGIPTVAAIAVQRWLDPILVESGFDLVNHIVLMELDLGDLVASPKRDDYLIRAMRPDDLPGVVDVDAAAFEPLWRNSLEALTHALGQSSYASVAEAETGLVGYQLSTGGVFGTHLARIAVRPAMQRRGLGKALIQDLIAHVPPGRERRLTLNTQANNAASQSLYARIGFKRTGERFPVFALTIPSRSGTVAAGAGRSV